MANGCKGLIHPCKKGFFSGTSPTMTSICCHDCEEPCEDMCQNRIDKCGNYRRALPPQITHSGGHNYKRVAEYTIDGDLINIWKSVCALAFHYGRTEGHMVNIVSKDRFFEGSYWSYLDSNFKLPSNKTNPWIDKIDPKTKEVVDTFYSYTEAHIDAEVSRHRFDTLCRIGKVAPNGYLYRKVDV